MIHRNSQTLQIPSWQNTLSRSINCPESLFEALDLPQGYLAEAQDAHRLFPLKVTLPYLSRIKKGDINDPLLKQVLPLGYELQSHPGFKTDPVGDLAAEKLPGLIHKYQGRVLLTLTGACGIHCRYCFRRHFDYSSSNPTRQHWQAIQDYLQSDPSIFEIIFSGGDPLSLSDHRLKRLVEDLEDIPHIQFLRIHTRQPVVLPERIDQALLKWGMRSRLKINYVLHINHSQEIDQQVEEAISRLKKAGFELYNQSVLLKGINDDSSTLIQLSIKLGLLGINPYYLHLMDKVTGASHFEVSQGTAEKIVNEMRSQLPGYLIPKLVREIKGQSSKSPVN